MAESPSPWFESYKSPLPKKREGDPNTKHRLLFLITLIGLLATMLPTAFWPGIVQIPSSAAPAVSYVARPVTEIAHAGGEIHGLAYTNSLEALNFSYSRGFRYFEVDLNLTTDGQIVLLHDWDNMPGYLFNSKSGQRTLAEFMHLKMIRSMHQLSLGGFAGWLTSHPDSTVVLHTKVESLAVLSHISERYPKLRRQMIPYVLDAEQYNQVRNLGFTQIMLLGGELTPTDEDIVALATTRHLFAVAIPHSRAKTDLTISLNARGVKTYAWTVNDEASRDSLRQNRAFGLLTDFLPITDPELKAVAQINAATQQTEAAGD